MGKASDSLEDHGQFGLLLVSDASPWQPIIARLVIGAGSDEYVRTRVDRLRSSLGGSDSPGVDIRPRSNVTRLPLAKSAVPSARAETRKAFCSFEKAGLT